MNDSYLRDIVNTRCVRIPLNIVRKNIDDKTQYPKIFLLIQAKAEIMPLHNVLSEYL